MEVIKTAIDGVFILEPRIFNDARGYFFESFSGREFEEKVCRTTFVQDNESFSTYGVLRGLHFQKPPFTQSHDILCHFATISGRHFPFPCLLTYSIVMDCRFPERILL